MRFVFPSGRDLALELSRESLGPQFGGFSGRVMAQLASAVVAHDPVVETLVRCDVKGGGRHRLEPFLTTRTDRFPARRRAASSAAASWRASLRTRDRHRIGAAARRRNSGWRAPSPAGR